MILDDILAHKRHEVAASMRQRSLASVRSEAFRQPPPRPFGVKLRASTGTPARLIAEIKRRSPSAGAMADVPDPVTLARTYEANGASAISTLTDGHFFGGSLDDLRAVSKAVTIPVLRKDFLFTEYQLWEARAAGADAALLIVAALASPLATPGNADELDHPIEDGDPDLDIASERLAHLLGVARGVGLEILVEVHDEAEAAVALSVNAAIIGINNRDLRTFITTLDATERVALRLPRGTNGPVIVSESGLHDHKAVERVRVAGAHAILVGEALVRAPDIGAKVREMSGTVLMPGATDAHGVHQSSTAPRANRIAISGDGVGGEPGVMDANSDHIRVKICGIRSVDVALACARAGVDFLGYNFAPVSRRRIDPAIASRAIEALKAERSALQSMFMGRGGARGSASEISLDHEQSTIHPSTPFAVGIFVNQSAREIDDIARECGLDIVQLSGTETPEECTSIAETTGLPIIKAVRLTSASDHEPISSFGSLPNLFALLADTPGTWGGTGEPWDYASVRTLAFASKPHLFLAGGLTPETVGEAIRHARPWGVDVASGVETNGMTDTARVHSFIKSVRTSLLAPVTSREAYCNQGRWGGRKA